MVAAWWSRHIDEDELLVALRHFFNREGKR